MVRWRSSQALVALALLWGAGCSTASAPEPDEPFLARAVRTLRGS